MIIRETATAMFVDCGFAVGSPLVLQTLRPTNMDFKT